MSFTRTAKTTGRLSMKAYVALVALSMVAAPLAPLVRAPIAHAASSPAIIAPDPGLSYSAFSFHPQVSWGSTGTCAYNYDLGYSEDTSDWTPISCDNDGSAIPAPDTDGVHVLYIQNWDSPDFGDGSAGTQASFTYDTQAPNVSIDSPASGEIADIDWGDPQVSWEDSTTCEYKLDDGEYTTAESGCTAGLSIDKPELGDHTLMVRGTDDAGNSSTDSIAFTLDAPDSEPPDDTCGDPSANNFGDPGSCTYDDPPPDDTCSDPSANNFGDPGSCTYDSDPPPVNVPEVTTDSVDSITQTSAVTYGTVTDTGGGAINDEGILYDTASETDFASYAFVAYADAASPSIATSLTELSCGTTYYYRTFARNEAGYGYGDEEQFTTSDCDVAQPVGYWSLNEATSTAAYDSSENENDGTLHGGTWGTGIFGGGLTLNGSGEYVSVSSPSNIPIGNSHYAISAWFKSTTPSEGGFAGWGTYNTTDSDVTNALRFASSGNCSDNNGFDNYWWGDDFSACAPDGVNVHDGEWHQVIAEYDGTNRKMYLDGAEIGSDTPTGTLAVASADNLTIGLTDPAYGEYFNGTLDDVRIYDEALSDDEVAASYGDGSGGPTVPSVSISNPTSNATITNWIPSVNWDTATTCAYKYDDDDYTTLGSCGNALPEPSGPGEHTLFLRGSNTSGASVTGVSFITVAPTEVGSCADLEAVNGALAGSYILTRSLDCRTEGNSVRIASGDTPFSGTFNGNGHKVTVSITTSDDFVGLFGTLDGAKVKNLWVAGSVSGGGFVGAVAGLATDDTIISDVQSSASVTGTGSSVGGIAGELTLSSYIENSYATGAVFGNNSVGGITGSVNSSVLQYDYFSGSVSAVSDTVGGIVGFFANSELHHDFNVGSVEGGANVGGLIGRRGGGSDIIDSYFDVTRSGQTEAIDAGTDDTAGGTPVNDDGSDADYFKGNNDNDPLHQWDFTDTWETNTDAFPSLRAFAGVSGTADVTYRYLRWDITKTKAAPADVSCDTGCTQVSEFELLEDGHHVAWPEGTVATNPDGRNPGDQTPDKLIDGATNDKWLDHNFNSLGFGQTGRASVVIDTGSDHAVTFNGYRFVTGGDESKRDPVSWDVLGSADGINWTFLATTTDETITNDREAATQDFTLDPVATVGDGSNEHPIQITTCTGLELMNASRASTFELENDLDCSAEGNAVMIGREVLYFKGSFDGKGHTITVNIGSIDSAGGLFEYTNGATISNLTVAGTVTGLGLLGGLIGSAFDTQVNRVSVSANVTSGGGTGVGGLIGSSEEGSISNAFTTGNVTGVQAVGGLLGAGTNTNILNAYASGHVSGHDQTGGLFGGGTMLAGGIENSFATGLVSQLGEGTIGALSGDTDPDVQVFINSYFDEHSTGLGNCNGSGGVTGCTSVNADRSDHGHFFSSANQPLSTWDFSRYMWHENADAFPTFTTPFIGAPRVSTETFTDDMTSSTTQAVVFAGSIDALGASDIFDRGFEYGTTTSYGSTTDEGIDGAFSTGDFTLGVDDLSCNTTYHFRAFATDEYDTVHGANVSFTTHPCETITIESPTDGAIITESSWNPSVDWTGFSLCAYAYDSDDYTELGDCGDLIAEPDTAGVHTLHVRGTDDAENVITQSVSFTYAVPDNFEGLGSGSSDDPYQITSCLELQEMNTDEEAGYKLMNDIDCSATSGWNDGRGFNPVLFDGTLNGEGYRIENLFVDRPEEFVGGLFGELSGAVFNLHMDGGSITAGSATGSIAGAAGGGFTMIGVSSNASIFTVNSFEGISAAGGLIGVLFEGGTLSQSSFTGTSTVSEEVMGVAGGLIGQIIDGGTVSNSFASSTESGFAVGGLVGVIEGDGGGVTIDHSYAAGSMTGAIGAGGLIGFGADIDTVGTTTISSSFSVASITSFESTGGIIGYLGLSNIVFNSVYYDQTQSDGSFCLGSADEPGDPDGCTAVNTDGTDGAHYLGTSDPSIDPLGDFDFNTIWMAADGEYPQLRNDISLGTAQAPTDFRAGIIDGLSMPVFWTAPADTGGFSIDYYQYFIEPVGADLDVGDDGTSDGGFDPDQTNGTITDPILEYGHSYDVRIRAVTDFGAGSWSDPVTVSYGVKPMHHIASCEDLQNLGDRQYVFGDDIVLDTDIDCSAIENFTPLGTHWANVYSGTFNGQGYTISGLTINYPDTSDIGLFRETEGATLENVSLTTSGEGAGGVSGDGMVGALVGFAQDTVIQNISSTLPVSGNTESDGENIGGLVGQFGSYGTTVSLNNSSVAADVSGKAHVGGLVGDAYGEDPSGRDSNVTFSHDSYEGNVTADAEAGGSYAGGLIGQMQMVPSHGTSHSILTISGNHTSGSVTGTNNIGGLIGEIDADADHTSALSVSITHDYSTATVQGESAIGGLVGTTGVSNNSSIPITFTWSYTFATGDVTSGDGENTDVGGLGGEVLILPDVGSINATLSDSYATGNVSTNDASSWVGGLLGDSNGMAVKRTYATGSVSANQGAGGLVGALDNGTITDSFSVGEVDPLGEASSIGGFLGVNYFGSIANDYFDVDQSGQSGCVDGADADGCTVVSGDLTYFTNTSHVQPFSDGASTIWDFSTVWKTVINGYPEMIDPLDDFVPPQPIVLLPRSGGKLRSGSTVSTGLSPRASIAALQSEIAQLEAQLAALRTSVSIANLSHDLSFGARGVGVKTLQAFLIAQNAGLDAAALARQTATGYFGTYTRAALAEYQNMHAIVPASGYFGTITRAYLAIH